LAGLFSCARIGDICRYSRISAAAFADDSQPMRYSFRTLFLLMAVVPPVIGFWPDLKRAAINKATQVTASDIVIATAASTHLLIRWRVDRQTQLN
jgi:hypothetical protein